MVAAVEGSVLGRGAAGNTGNGERNEDLFNLPAAATCLLVIAFEEFAATVTVDVDAQTPTQVIEIVNNVGQPQRIQANIFIGSEFTFSPGNVGVGVTTSGTAENSRALIVYALSGVDETTPIRDSDSVFSNSASVLPAMSVTGVDGDLYIVLGNHANSAGVNLRESANTATDRILVEPASHSAYAGDDPVGASPLTFAPVIEGDSSLRMNGLALIFQQAIAGGAIEGTAAGSTTASGTLSATGGLAGSSDGATTSTGTIIGVASVGGTASGSTVVSGTIFAIGDLTGASDGSTVVAGTLSAVGDLAGVSDGSTVSTGTLSATGDLAGSSAGSTVLSGTLSLPEGGISGTSAGSTVLSGTLFAIGSLSGTSAGSSSLIGALAGIASMSGTASGSTVLVGTLVVPGSISGLAAGSTVLSGTLFGVGSLVGVSAGSSFLTGTLNGTSDFPRLGVTAQNVSFQVVTSLSGRNTVTKGPR